METADSRQITPKNPLFVQSIADGCSPTCPLITRSWMKKRFPKMFTFFQSVLVEIFTIQKFAFQKDAQPRSSQKTLQSRRQTKSEGNEKEATAVSGSRSTRGRMVGVFQPCRTGVLPPLPNVPSPVSSIVSATEEKPNPDLPEAECEVDLPQASHPHVDETKKNLRYPFPLSTSYMTSIYLAHDESFICLNNTA